MSATEPPFLADLRREFERVAEADAAAGRRAPRKLPRLRELRLRVALPVATAVALFLGAGAVTTGVITLSIDLGEHDRPAQEQTDGQVAGSPAFAAPLRAAIGALRREPTAADAIDPSLRGALSPNVLADEALRVVPPLIDPAGSPTLWLVPTRAGDLGLATWVRGDASAVVATEADLAATEQGRAVVKIGEQYFGVVPDGVAQVTVTGGDGAARTLPVQDNVFTGSGLRGVPRITWEGQGGGP